MSFLEVLSAVLIGPLKLLFEVVYVIACKLIGDFGLSIIALSLIMNFLVLPLYRRADAMQEEARDTENKLHKGVAHIKKAFSGDEQMMILQTYYRQNDYRPTDALRGSVSLLLEIPFFIAAYQFLSHLELLNGVSFGPIADLSAPDGLLTLGGVTINLLPILMTLINVISSALFLKGHPLKTKIQLYAMALFFLVFLYTSPSGLVFYWTLNNLFSLCKTIFYKLKNPKKVAAVLAAIVGACLIALAIVNDLGGHFKVRIALACLGVAMLMPVVLLKKHARTIERVYTPDKKLFALCALFLTVLIGALIPSAYIAASPQEYVDIFCFVSPLWYVCNTFSLAVGTFVVWLGVFYWLASDKGKVIFERLLCVMCAVMLANYMFFGTDFGIISSNLKYESGLVISLKQMLLNLAVLAVTGLAVYFAVAKWHKTAGAVILTALLAVGGMSTLNIIKTVEPIQLAEKQAEEYQASLPGFELSKTGKNVVVLMMDRAMGEFVPYILNEKPELKDKFDGFTYYSNVISHGGNTNFGSPGLFGGYEYTPVEMNKRDTEKLVDKHNEALLMMPVLFSENGYDVTVCDPPYANYQWIPDLSIYDDYPEIDAYITSGRFTRTNMSKTTIEATKRNFFCFSLMKTLPLCMQEMAYDEGRYNSSEMEKYYNNQNPFNISIAEGYCAAFLDEYDTLANMVNMTNLTDEPVNTFLSFANSTTHVPTLLQAPDYTPEYYVDNTYYDDINMDRFTLNGKTLHVDVGEQMPHYHINMAMFIQLGNWFDYLRENGVYDNTRIIIVSDHGYGLGCLDEMISPDNNTDLSAYYPLLFVKDFNATGFTTSDEFMTNADVPTLATKGVVDEPINPFTGKRITNTEKTAHEQIVVLDGVWETNINNGNTFLPSTWASVHDDIWDLSNWSFCYEELVLKEHALP